MKNGICSRMKKVKSWFCTKLILSFTWATEFRSCLILLKTRDISCQNIHCRVLWLPRSNASNVQNISYNFSTLFLFSFSSSDVSIIQLQFCIGKKKMYPSNVKLKIQRLTNLSVFLLQSEKKTVYIIHNGNLFLKNHGSKRENWPPPKKRKVLSKIPTFHFHSKVQLRNIAISDQQFPPFLNVQHGPGVHPASSTTELFPYGSMKLSLSSNKHHVKYVWSSTFILILIFKA